MRTTAELIALINQRQAVGGRQNSDSQLTDLPSMIWIAIVDARAATSMEIGVLIFEQPRESCSRTKTSQRLGWALGEVLVGVRPNRRSG